MKTTFHPSTGDVFRDLGFSAVESEDLRLRSDLIIELQRQIACLGRSQTEIAKLLGITQPRVSNLAKGRLDLFSLDTLVEMLDKLGNRVDVTVRAKDSAEPSIPLVVDAPALTQWLGLTASAIHVAYFEGPSSIFSALAQGDAKTAADNQYALAA